MSAVCCLSVWLSTPRSGDGRGSWWVGAGCRNIRVGLDLRAYLDSSEVTLWTTLDWRYSKPFAINSQSLFFCCQNLLTGTKWKNWEIWLRYQRLRASNVREWDRTPTENTHRCTLSTLSATNLVNQSCSLNFQQKLWETEGLMLIKWQQTTHSVKCFICSLTQKQLPHSSQLE